MMDEVSSIWCLDLGVLDNPFDNGWGAMPADLIGPGGDVSLTIDPDGIKWFMTFDSERETLTAVNLVGGAPPTGLFRL